MECPLCTGAPERLGRLGRLFWFRCRDCGHQWSQEPERLDWDAIE